MENDSKAKMMASAAALIATRGVSGTSFTGVLEASGAPRGSIYHHFPDGKTQLVAETVRWVAERVAAHQSAYEGTSAEGALERFIAMWRKVVAASQGKQGCAIAGVTVDAASIEPVLAEAVRAAFRSWVELLAGQFRGAGMSPDRARGVATMAVAAMEGALILCRAEGSVRPLDTVAKELSLLVAGKE